ncbi:MAG: DUF1501 domain-containing protein [Myxococcota bacterium]
MTSSSRDSKRGLSRRTFLGGTAAVGSALALPGSRARAGSVGPARHLIVVVAAGGWDTSYALDPKPGNTNVDVPDGDIQMFGNLPIWTDASRPATTAFFSDWAAHTAVVNGINVRSIAHPECRRRVMTGTPGTGRPDVAALTAQQHGLELPVPYMILGNNAYTGPLASIAGRVGPTNQIKALLDPTEAYPAPDGSPFAHGGYEPTANDEALIRDYVVASAERVRAQRGQRGHNAARIDDFVDSLGRGDVLRTQADGFGARGQTLNFSAQADMAVRVLSEGISRTVNIDTGISWDTHDDNAPQAASHEALFTQLSSLAQSLAETPGVLGGSTLMDETVVMVLSEMSRTPRLNAEGGKDHWPVASAMVMGAGVAGGQVLGATNDLVEAEPIDLQTGKATSEGTLLSTGSFVGGVLELVGVDPTEPLPNDEPLHALSR